MGNEPRLFINSPSYFLDISEVQREIDLEESTSVFVKDQTVDEPKNEKKDEVINEHVLKQLQFLEKPFRQKAYQPLLICLKDGRKLKGTASEVQDDSLLLTSVELQTQEIIHIEDVLQVLWRGRPLPTI